LGDTPKPPAGGALHLFIREQLPYPLGRFAKRLYSSLHSPVYIHSILIALNGQALTHLAQP